MASVGTIVIHTTAAGVGAFTQAPGAFAVTSQSSAFAVGVGGPPTQFGLYYVGAPGANVAIGANLGVTWQRMSADAVAGPTTAQIALAAAYRAAGFKVELTISSERAPPPDPVAYQAGVAACLDAILPDLCNINNETNLTHFYTGTAAQYLAQLTLAVQVAHSTGPYAGQGRNYRIASDGVSSNSIGLNYWKMLWTSGQWTEADAFSMTGLNGALGGSPANEAAIYGDLPSTANPYLPTLGGHPELAAALPYLTTLLAGLRATGVDYFNMHMYWWQPDASPQLAAMKWAVGQTGGMQATCNEAGQRATTPGTITAMVANARALGLPLMIMFSSPGDLETILGNPDGSLTQSGLEFQGAVKLGLQPGPVIVVGARPPRGVPAGVPAIAVGAASRLGIV